MAYDNTNKGAIWKKTAKSGLEYKSGRLNVEGKEFNISIFDNNKDGNPARPDYNIVIEPADEQQGGGQQAPAATTQNKAPQDISVEDIPF